jgi:hypothetical protein
MLSQFHYLLRSIARGKRLRMHATRILNLNLPFGCLFQSIAPSFPDANPLFLLRYSIPYARTTLCTQQVPVPLKVDDLHPLRMYFRTYPLSTYKTQSCPPDANIPPVLRNPQELHSPRSIHPHDRIAHLCYDKRDRSTLTMCWPGADVPCKDKV